jgi:hypothetical protein
MMSKTPAALDAEKLQLKELVMVWSAWTKTANASAAEKHWTEFSKSGNFLSALFLTGCFNG